MKRHVVNLRSATARTETQTCSSSRCNISGFLHNQALHKFSPTLLSFLPKQSNTESREKESKWNPSRIKKKMECVFGLVGNGFTIVVADTSAVHSILVHKSNEDKIMVLDSHKLIAASGEPGDRSQSYSFLLSFDFSSARC